MVVEKVFALGHVRTVLAETSAAPQCFSAPVHHPHLRTTARALNVFVVAVAVVVVAAVDDVAVAVAIDIAFAVDDALVCCWCVVVVMVWWWLLMLHTS